MKYESLIAALAIAGATFAFSGGAQALEQKPVLDLTTAEIAANACLAHQATTGYAAINVVVVDDGGNTILLKRQDGACKACGAIAEGKARTAALYNMTTRTMEAASFGPAKDGVAADLPGAPFIPGIVAFPGGLPVQVDGAPIGGIGVSGASADEDEACATAALDAIKGVLN